MRSSNIDPADIQLQVHANNWEDALKVAAQPLVNDCKITDDYVNSMIESVHKLGPYIVLLDWLLVMLVRRKPLNNLVSQLLH